MAVRVTGIRETRDAVMRATMEISDSERKLLILAQKLDELTRAASAQTPEGIPWAPRKTTTVRRAGQRAGVRTPDGGTLGILTGKMIRSINVTVSRDKAILRVGTGGGARHAKYFVGYSSRQPARPILPSHQTGLSQRELDAWADRLAEDVARMFRRG
jgi:hypothetical protein